MSERAIELYKQAAMFAYEICDNAGRKGGGEDHIWLSLTTGKFAELIVSECIKQAKSVGDLRGITDDMIYGADVAAAQISKHFGVKS